MDAGYPRQLLGPGTFEVALSLRLTMQAKFQENKGTDIIPFVHRPPGDADDDGLCSLKKGTRLHLFSSTSTVTL